MSGVLGWRFGRRGRAALVALLFASGNLSTAAMAFEGLPDFGDAAQAVVTPQDERRLGEQTMQQIHSGGGYLDDPEVNAYLNMLGLPGGQ